MPVTVTTPGVALNPGDAYVAYYLIDESHAGQALPCCGFRYWNANYSGGYAGGSWVRSPYGVAPSLVLDVGWDVFSDDLKFDIAFGAASNDPTPAPVPLPAAAPLLLAGFGALALMRRRRRVAA
jgi:hypothetical protein